MNRIELANSAVHRPLQGGICGGKDGAESIVVSGGYVDDEDYGDEIIYTGQGGNDPVTKRQISDQVLTRGNAGLARNQVEGNPVRVIRGSAGDPTYSPSTGYRYDGLFRVVDHWRCDGRDGFKIWRFRLVGLENVDRPPVNEPPEGAQRRVSTVIQRIVRSSSLAIELKRLHDYRCQICGIQLITPVGPYVEAAHIRALGHPHHGQDSLANMLCLCPNHHVMFDTGTVYLDDDLVVWNAVSATRIGMLRTVRTHVIERDNLVYHRIFHVSSEAAE